MRKSMNKYLFVVYGPAADSGEERAAAFTASTL